LWWLAALFHFVAQNKLYGYHGLPLLAPGAAMAAWCVGATFERAHLRALPRLTLVLAVAITVAAATVRAGRSANQLLKVANGRLQLDEVYARYGTYGEGDYSVQADLEVAAYLRAHTDVSDTVFIWGFEPTVYFLAERSPASRFLYSFPLYGEFGWEHFRDQLITDLGRNRPLYIVVVENDAIPWVTGTEDDSMTALQGFPELRDLIAHRYQFEVSLEHFHMYRRLSQTASARPDGDHLADAHLPRLGAAKLA
jgi:hypothetical protein